MGREERRKHLRKNVFRTRIRVIKWLPDKAEIIEFGGHHYKITNEFEDVDIAFKSEDEKQEFSSMASAILKAMEPEGG